ncbi:MAG TPA: Ku protein [Burkholderiales bacterium]|nr:Ku protein [Burkholderiales bacterium]
MPRTTWKGAISFGLVHIPVALYPASRDDDINFDWLDKRSMDPVGYKRINKRTGKEIDKENIVKGIEHGDGEYVVISDDEIKKAYPKTTQTIEIEAFVGANEIPFLYLERPYYLAPSGKGSDKVYALLREALHDAGRVGIARVVISNKQHLAAVIPAGRLLVLNILRWASEIRPADEIDIPEAGKKAAGLKEAELKMAKQLIEEMATEWNPEDYADNFKEAVMTLVEEKVKAGETATVTPLEDVPAEARSNVIDVTELLKQSLNKGKPALKKTPAKETHAKAAAKKAAPTRKRA